MCWSYYTATVPRTDFAHYLDVIALLTNLRLSELPAGLSEIRSDDGLVSFAYRPDDRYLAVRMISADKCLETFFACPKTKTPRVGLALLSRADIPAPLKHWLDERRHAVATLPSFTQLSALAIRPDAPVQVVGERERLLEAELDYVRRLMSDQADELRQAKAALQPAGIEAPTTTPAGAAETAHDAGPQLDTLAQWCMEHEDEIVVLPRARNGAKKSVYENPALIGRALAILAGPYREMRLGRLDQTALDKILRETGLRLSRSTVPSVAGEQGDAYFVSWMGGQRMLNLHLAKGGGRDDRYCFRLYFFWDEASNRPIVGSMPAHLSNSLT